MKKNIRLLAWFNFFVDFTLYAPIAIIYFSSVAGSYSLGLAVFSVEMFTASLFEIPTGVLSDYVGRRKTILFGALAGLTAGICYAVGLNFWVLVIGSVFAGLARAFYSGNNDAFLHDTLKDHGAETEYAYYSGKTESMFQMALAVSAIIGGVIAHWSFSLLMWVSVIPRVAGIIVAYNLKEPGRTGKTESSNIYSHLKESIRQYRINPGLRWLSSAYILEHGIGETLYEFRSIFTAMLWPVWSLGIAKALSNVCATAGLRVGSAVQKKIGASNTLITASVYNRIAAITAVVLFMPVSPVLMSTTSFFSGLEWNTRGALFQKYFTSAQRATMGSINSLAGSLFFSIFAYCFGLLADTLQPAKAIIMGELFMIAVIVIYTRFLRKYAVQSG